MANTIDTGLINEVISQNVIQAYNDALTPMSVFSTSYGNGSDKIVNVPSFAADTASNWAGDYTTGADATVSNIAVTIDSHKYVTIHLTDKEAMDHDSATLANLGIQAGQALADAVFADVLADVTAANFGAAAFTGLASTFDSDDVVDIKDACDTANLPRLNRGLLLDPSYFNALLKDTSIKDASAYGSSDAVQGGLIERLNGFKIYETPAIPANGENLVGFACTPGAIGLAVRYLQPLNTSAYAQTQMLTHAETGLTLGSRMFSLPETGATYFSFECNYGSAVARGADIKRMVSV